jgi:hypothetical protein
MTNQVHEVEAGSSNGCRGRAHIVPHSVGTVDCHGHGRTAGRHHAHRRANASPGLLVARNVPALVAVATASIPGNGAVCPSYRAPTEKASEMGVAPAARSSAMLAGDGCGGTRQWRHDMASAARSDCVMMRLILRVTVRPAPSEMMSAAWRNGNGRNLPFPFIGGPARVPGRRCHSGGGLRRRLPRPPGAGLGHGLHRRDE